MHIRNEYLHPTANNGRAQAEQMYSAPQGTHYSYTYGYEPYLLKGSDGATYAMNPGDRSWWPFASAANASFSAANARYAPICSGNPYIQPDAYYQHAVAPAFVQYLPQYAEFYAPLTVAAAPEMLRAPHESNRAAHESYQAAQSAQRPMSPAGADTLKAPKPKRPDDDVPNIVVEDCDTGDAHPPVSGSATNSSDSTHLHPHWHERSASPSDGSPATNPPNGSPATNSSEGPRLQVHPRILAIKSISCHCTPRASTSTGDLPAESPTAHPSFPSSTSVAPTADDGRTAPIARPVSSPPIMAAAIVHMFPFSPLVPKLPLGSLHAPAGSLGAPAGSFKTRLPPGFVPGVLSPWVVDGRGLSLQPSPAGDAIGLQPITAGDAEPLPPYSPAPSMGSVTSHWDGERLASDPWGPEGAVRRWVEELDKFMHGGGGGMGARSKQPTLAKVSKVKGTGEAKADDAGEAKVKEHSEDAKVVRADDHIDLLDHTDVFDHIPWPILHDPESPALDVPRSSSLSIAHSSEVAPRDTTSSSPDLAHSITPLSVNLFFRAARRVTLDDYAARQVTLNDHAAHCLAYNVQPRTPSNHTAHPITPDDCAWRALLRKSHRAFRRTREVAKGRLEEIMQPAGSKGKSVHWKDDAKGAKMNFAEDDEVVVYMTGDVKRDESAKDGRDDHEEQNVKRQDLADARPQKLEDALRAINVVLQTLDVLRRLDGY